MGQTNDYSSVTDLITQWPTAAQNQGIKLFGIAFDGGETGFSLASAIDSNKVSNVGQNGIPLQGGSTNIDNNDITNANTSDALTWGGIPVQDSSLFAGSALQTVDMLSNFITNFLNPVPGTSGIGAPKVKINYNDLLGGTGPNGIARVGASLDPFNLFPTSVRSLATCVSRF